MTTLTEVVAAVVVQSSAAALSHFGATLEPPAAEASAPAAANGQAKVVARSRGATAQAGPASPRADKPSAAKGPSQKA